MVPEQAVSYGTPAQVGAERGEVESTSSADREADLEVRVDLGTQEALPKGSTLLVELSDVSVKDEPKKLAQERVDVSGKKGVIPVTLRLPANLLLESERVSLTGRIEAKGVMHAISPVPVLVDGPFEVDGEVATLPREEALLLELSSVPNYKKPPPPKRVYAPVVGTQPVDTGRPTSVGGPEPEPTY